MPYTRRRTCPICGKSNLLKLSEHLRQVHGLSSEARQPWLRQASHTPPIPTQTQSPKDIPLSQLPIIIPPEDVPLQQFPVTSVYTSTAPPLLPSVVVNRKRPFITSGKRKAVLTKKRKVLKKSSKRKPIKKRKLQTKSKKPRKQPVYDSSDEEEDEEIINPKTKRELEQNWLRFSEQEDSDSREGEGDDEETDSDDINNMTLEEAFYKRPSIPSKYRGGRYF